MSADLTDIGQGLGQALAERDPAFQLREETPADREFLCELYRSTRWDELAPLDWPEQTKRDFLADQFSRQTAHYREYFADADWLIIERHEPAAFETSELTPTDAEAIGRIYVHASKADLRLMDIALLPSWRGQGIGTALVRQLCHMGDARACEVSLHVEPNNPAQRLYRRFGFEPVEQRGAYEFLRYTPLSAGKAQRVS